MDGPINFGDRDSWWGLLVKGFDDKPMYGCPYNPEYYRPLFENYGFQNYFNQHTYSRELKAGLFPPNVYERVKRLKEEPAYHFDHLHKKHLLRYVDDFMAIYNGAWAKFDGVKPIDREHTMALLKTMKPIIDEKLMYFAYYNEQPIGFFLMVPDLNGIIAPFHGKFGWINKLRFLWRLKVTHKSDRIMGLIFGVIPEFQGKGIESGMIERFEQEVALGTLKRYSRGLELVWIGDFNPVMMRMVETMVIAKPYRMFTTYRYLFDRTKEFHRAPGCASKNRHPPHLPDRRPQRQLRLQPQRLPQPHRRRPRPLHQPPHQRPYKPNAQSSLAGKWAGQGQTNGLRQRVLSRKYYGVSVNRTPRTFILSEKGKLSTTTRGCSIPPPNHIQHHQNPANYAQQPRLTRFDRSLRQER